MKRGVLTTFPFTYNFNVDKTIYRKKTFKLRSIRTNWLLVNEYLEEELPVFMSVEYGKLSASKKYDKFIETITNAIKTHTPNKKNVNNKIHNNPVPWWNQECDKAKRLRTCAFLKWKHTQLLNDYIEYKKRCAIANKTFKSKRREHYKAFAQSLDITTNAKYVWNTCKILKNK